MTEKEQWKIIINKKNYLLKKEKDEIFILFPRIYMNFDLPSLKEVDNALISVKQSFQKYPKDLLKRNLSTIYLVRNFYIIDLKSFNVLGYCLGDKIIIDIFDVEDQNLVESIFHHEFSSILLENYSQYFNKKEWIDINDKDWQYLEEMYFKDDFIDKYSSEELLKKGFLRSYAQHSLENDLNIFAELAFTNNEDLNEKAQKYEKIQKKYELFKTFYSKISSEIKFDLNK